MGIKVMPDLAAAVIKCYQGIEGRGENNQLIVPEYRGFAVVTIGIVKNLTLARAKV